MAVSEGDPDPDEDDDGVSVWLGVPDTLGLPLSDAVPVALRVLLWLGVGACEGVTEIDGVWDLV